MSRAFGDTNFAAAGVMAEPELSEATLTSADRFVIWASDGVWDYVTSQQACAIVDEHWRDGPLAAAQSLVCKSAERWRLFAGRVRGTHAHVALTHADVRAKERHADVRANERHAVCRCTSVTTAFTCVRTVLYQVDDITAVVLFLHYPKGSGEASTDAKASKAAAATIRRGVKAAVTRSMTAAMKAAATAKEAPKQARKKVNKHGRTRKARKRARQGSN